MTNLKKLALGAAMAAGVLGVGAAPAQAARVGIYVGVGGPAYVPPCPGPGYAWVAGYWNGGYWVPGYWNFVGVGPAYGGGYVIDRGPGFYSHRDWDRDDYRRWDRDRRDWDRDRDRHFDRDDHFRR